MEEKEEKILIGHMLSLANRSSRDNYPTHSEFLSLTDQNLVFAYLKKQNHGNLPKTISDVSYLVYGGNEDSDRKMFFFYPEYMSEEECLDIEADTNSIALLHVYPKNAKFADHLTHRDFLGALMNLGYERNRIGDILTDGTDGYIYLEKAVSEDISQLLTKVRHTTVNTELLNPSQCPFKPKFREVSFTVKSPRIDTILKEVFHLSRRSAQTIIAEEMVFINGLTIKNNDHHPKENDRVSVRGEGKFIYLGESGVTKRNRIACKVKIYD